MIQTMAARDKAMNTWSKGKGVKDQVSDEEESGKDGETSMASKVRKKRRRTSEALQFLEQIYSRFVQNVKHAKPTFSTRRGDTRTTA